MAIGGGVDACIQNRKTAALEVATSTHKQVRAIWAVDQHFQAFTRQRQAGAHNRRGAANVARQVARVPGNVGGLVAHEIAHIQRLPQVLVGLVGQGAEGQQNQGLAFARFNLGSGIWGAPAQHAHAGAVQVFQQFAFPGVPHFGAGTTDVCHGEQVQRRQAAFGANALGKRRHHVGVVQVLFLRYLAHGEVFAHQKFGQFGVSRVQLVLAAKAAHFLRANV